MGEHVSRPHANRHGPFLAAEEMSVPVLRAHLRRIHGRSVLVTAGAFVPEDVLLTMHEDHHKDMYYRHGGMDHAHERESGMRRVDEDVEVERRHVMSVPPRHMDHFDWDYDDEERREHMRNVHGMPEEAPSLAHRMRHASVGEGGSTPAWVEKRREALRAAEDIVCGQDARAEEYGGAEDSFGAIAELWSTIIRNRLPVLYAQSTHGEEGNRPTRAAVDSLRRMLASVDLEEADVALMMGEVKTARLLTNIKHRDSWVDKSGYAACGYDKSGAGT